MSALLQVKKETDLSYRSHRSRTASSSETFEIRPLFPIDKRKWPAMGRRSEPAGSPAGSVTGIPCNWVLELDEPLNTLDPGQLLRESAAAASRAALLSDPRHVTVGRQSGPLESLPPPPPRSVTAPRRRNSSLVDELLYDINHDRQEPFDADVFSSKKRNDCPPFVTDINTLRKRGNVTHYSFISAGPRGHFRKQFHTMFECMFRMGNKKTSKQTNKRKNYTHKQKNNETGLRYYRSDDTCNLIR